MPDLDPGADSRFMRRALSLAERGRGRVEPNPMVGAVIVRDGEVVGQGWHREYGQAHAEVEALRDAGGRARGATAYVTLEPCNHFGQTPPCSLALLEAGIARVVFACADPNPEAGGGAARLAAAGVSTTGGVEEEAARDLNARFLHGFSTEGARRPWVELKLALSLDARIADADGRSQWLTGEEARAEVHRLRAGHDAIAVGIETVIADDPRLTVRGETQPRRDPVRIVFDRRLRLPLESALARTAREVPVWVVCAPDAPEEPRVPLLQAGVEILPAEGLAEALAGLRAQGVRSMLCEGGARLGSALLDEGLVDRLSLFYAPLLVGPRGRGAFDGLPSETLDRVRRWRLVRSQPFGADTLIVLSR